MKRERARKDEVYYCDTSYNGESETDRRSNSVTFEIYRPVECRN